MLSTLSIISFNPHFIFLEIEVLAELIQLMGWLSQDSKPSMSNSRALALYTKLYYVSL